MGLFCRSPCPPPAQVPATPCPNVNTCLRSRNAFIHFLREFRQTHQLSGVPIWHTSMAAAKRWNRMSLHDKFCYIEAAHNSGYVYRARDRRMNRVMNLMRKSLAGEHNVNLIYLSSAVKQMQLWKRKTFKDIWRRT